jgi:hypothetical protein
MAPSLTKLKAIFSKVDAKLHNLKCKLHKNKTAGNKSETPVDAEVINMEQSTTAEPMHTHEEESVTADPNHTGVDGEEINSSTNSQTSQKLEKKAKREARREARKAKWAARRAAFKTKTIKIVDASIVPVAVALLTIFSPVIIAADIVFVVVKGVVLLIVTIVGLLCAPFLLCFMLK